MIKLIIKKDKDMGCKRIRESDASSKNLTVIEGRETRSKHGLCFLITIVVLSLLLSCIDNFSILSNPSITIPIAVCALILTLAYIFRDKFKPSIPQINKKKMRQEPEATASSSSSSSQKPPITSRSSAHNTAKTTSSASTPSLDGFSRVSKDSIVVDFFIMNLASGRTVDCVKVTTGEGPQEELDLWIKKLKAQDKEHLLCITEYPLSSFYTIWLDKREGYSKTLVEVLSSFGITVTNESSSRICDLQSLQTQPISGSHASTPSPTSVVSTSSSLPLTPSSAPVDTPVVDKESPTHSVSPKPHSSPPSSVSTDASLTTVPTPSIIPPSSSSHASSSSSVKIPPSKSSRSPSTPLSSVPSSSQTLPKVRIKILKNPDKAEVTADSRVELLQWSRAMKEKLNIGYRAKQNNNDIVFSRGESDNQCIVSAMHLTVRENEVEITDMRPVAEVLISLGIDKDTITHD